MLNVFFLTSSSKYKVYLLFLHYYGDLLHIGTHGISMMRILIPTLVSEFQILVSILGKFWPKKSKLSALTENCHTCYLDDADSYSNIRFMNFQL